jgi:hypothetical protein
LEWWNPMKSKAKKNHNQNSNSKLKVKLHSGNWPRNLTSPFWFAASSNPNLWTWMNKNIPKKQKIKSERLRDEIWKRGWERERERGEFEIWKLRICFQLYLLRERGAFGSVWKWLHTVPLPAASEHILFVCLSSLWAYWIGPGNKFGPLEVFFTIFSLSFQIWKTCLKEA